MNIGDPFLNGSKDEIPNLLAQFDRIGMTLPVWAVRLVNGLRRELGKAQAEYLLKAQQYGVRIARHEKSEAEAWAKYRELKATPDRSGELFEYAAHRAECGYYATDTGRPCTCGLDAILSRLPL